MFKVNLHAHSDYSDGYNTFEEMVVAYKDNGFSIAVFTEHICPLTSDRCMSYEQYLKQKEEAKYLSEKLNIPIVIGGEFYFFPSVERFMCAEEFLVFGEEAIEYLFSIKEERWRNHKAKNPTNKRGLLYIDDFREARKKFGENVAMILCHPALGVFDSVNDGKPAFIMEKGDEIIEGYEYYNKGLVMFGEKTYNNKKVPLEFEKLTCFSNSDTHDTTSFNLGYNLFSEKISSEKELIAYLREKKDIKMYWERPSWAD